MSGKTYLDMKYVNFIHKVLFLIFAVLFFVAPLNDARCQLVDAPYITIGVKGGGTASDMLYTKHAYSVYSHSPLFDYQAGAFVKIRATHRFGFELDVQYAGAGTNMTWADVDYTLHPKMIDVRMLQAIHFGNRRKNFSPYLNFGPVIGLTQGGNIEYQSDYTPYFTTPVTKGNYSTFDGGVYVGLGFDYQFYVGMNVAVISAEAGYRLGLLNTFSKNDKSEDAVIMNPEMDAPLYSAQRLGQGIELSVKLGIPIKIYKKQPAKIVMPRVVIPDIEEPVDTVEQEVEMPEFDDSYAQKDCYTLGEIRDKINKEENVSGLRICLFNILFDFDKSEIKDESWRIIADLASLMRKYPSLKIKVNGHTDSKGSDEYNQKLSEARARAVKYAIQQYGVVGDRIQWAGYGEHYPIDSNETELGRARNRRVEIDILTVLQNKEVKR